MCLFCHAATNFMQGCESVCEALGDVAAVLQATGGEGAEQQVGAARLLIWRAVCSCVGGCWVAAVVL